MADYYVDSTVASSGDGSISSPFKLLSDLTAAHAGISAGDTVYFKRGSVWYESYRAKSGELYNPITYDVYGTGDKPKILGYDLISDGAWTAFSGADGSDTFEAVGVGGLLSDSTSLTWTNLVGGSHVLTIDTFSNFGISASPYNSYDGGTNTKCVKKTAGKDGKGMLPVTAGTKEITYTFHHLSAGAVDVRGLREYITCVMHGTSVNDDLLEISWYVHSADSNKIKIRVYNRTTDAQLALGTTDFTSVIGNWNKIKVRVKLVDDGDDTVQVWVNDALEIDSTDAHFANNTIAAISLGDNSTAAINLYWDNFSYAEGDKSTYKPVAGYSTPWTGLRRLVAGYGYAFLYDNHIMQNQAVQYEHQMNSTGKWWIDETNDILYLQASESPTNIAVGIRENCFSFDNRNYVRVYNVEVGGSMGPAFLVNGDCHVIDTCLVSSSGYGGIGCGAMKNVLVRNCEITNCDHAGIFANTSGGIVDGFRILDTFIHDVKLEGIAFEQNMYHVEVCNCIIDTVDTPTSHDGGLDGCGIWLYNGPTGAYAKYVLRNNTILNCEGTCLLGVCDDAGNSLTLTKNIFDNSARGVDVPCVNLGYWSGSVDGLTGNVFSDYNLFWKNNVDGRIIWFKENATYKQSELANFVTATGFDQNSVNVNPNLDSNYRPRNRTIARMGIGAVMPTAQTLGGAGIFEIAP